MKNTFAIVCEWPGVNAAENETILRIKKAAELNSKQLLIIDKYGNILDNNFKKTIRRIKNHDVDFIINLHFASPKCYDGFSYVALWNPLKFYHDWSYLKHSFHLTSHHDFISCLSQPADHHATRISKHYKCHHLEPEIVINHTNCGPYYKFDNSRTGIFYCGINWDKSSGKSRFEEIFKTLDSLKILKIYGPRKLGKVKPWEGFISYVDEIPFDGLSTFKEISKCLLGLALSHEAHIESEIASSRVFELIAGGALPICDENPFFKQHFGDKVLYVNGSEKEKAIQINDHYNWALNNKNSVKGMVEILQKHMKANFDLSKQIKNLYDKHKQRRELIEQEYHARNKNFVINIIHVQEKSDNLQSIIDSVKNQSYPLIKLFIVSNIRDPETLSLLKRNDINYTFLEYNSCKLNNFGKVIAEIQPKLPSSENDLFLISRFGEDFFYDHLSSLVRVFEDNPNCQLAESSVIMYDNNEFGIYVNNIEFAPHISDHMFYTGSILTRSLPPLYILKYLNQRNYINSLNKHFEHKIKTNTPTMKYNVSHHTLDQYNDNTLCNSLTTETIITKPINTNLENVLNSKENAYKILSHIKFLRPIIKLRNQIKKLKRKI